MEKLYELEILTDADSPMELKFFKALFKEMLTLFTAPFNEEYFDFGADEFWLQIADLSQRYANDPQIRKMNGNRGSKHFLYMNRTFFGLYNLLHDLKAKVEVNSFRKYL
jgi:N-acetyl-beta-hexosaminidase